MITRVKILQEFRKEFLKIQQEEKDEKDVQLSGFSAGVNRCIEVIEDELEGELKETNEELLFCV
ncbi:TPA: hypothetical protein HA278_01120 [Candidatus Woesearchaeota archaeon]|nr:hypothetical protein [Candidatus Woesearchaeota archaeon]